SLEGAALFPRIHIRPLYLQHRRPRQPRLGVAGVSSERSRQIRKGGVELVHALTQGGAQHQHILRGLSKAPPWGERRFSVAGVARIAGGAAELEVAPRSPQGEGQIVRLAVQRGWLEAKVADDRIACPEGHPLEHLAVRFGDEWLSSRHKRHGRN